MKSKKEVIHLLAEKLDCHVVAAEKAYDALCEIICDEITSTAKTVKKVKANADAFKLNGVGIIYVRKLAARKARNPKTDERLKAQSKKVIRFRASKNFEKTLP